MSSEEDMVSNIEYLAPLGRSDHSILNFNIICSVKHTNPQIKVQYDKGQYSKMLNAFKNIDWETELNTNKEDIEKQWEIFKDKYHELEKECVPRKNVYINGKLNKKLSTPLDKKNLRLIKKKNKVWGKVRKELASAEESLHYNKLRNQVRRLTRKSKKLFEKNIAKNSKVNPKAFWKYTQSKLKTRSNIPDIETDEITADGKKVSASSDEKKASRFLSYFSSVLTVEPPGTDMPTFEKRDYHAELNDIKITEKIILDKLKKN